MINMSPARPSSDGNYIPKPYRHRSILGPSPSREEGGPKKSFSRELRQRRVSELLPCRFGASR